MAADTGAVDSPISLERLLSRLEERDSLFSKLAETLQKSKQQANHSLTIRVPEGLRPALIASLAQYQTVTVIVPSSRQAQETVSAIREWYSGDPRDIACLQSWETLPHERLSPRADTVASRLVVFRRLAHPQVDSELFCPIRVLVMPVRSLIQPIVGHLADIEPLVFRVGEELPMQEAIRRLNEHAYSRVDLVMQRGEFAVRGGILDVFAPTMNHPVRIEYFGDEVDTIKEFHASDQRTYGESINSVWASACRELPLTAAVRERAHALIGSIPNADDMLESISQGIAVEGMESLIPALVDHLQPVSDLFKKHSLIVINDLEKCRRAAQDLIVTANEFLSASWHVAASGHGAGAPINFDEASFFDFDETLTTLASQHHSCWNMTVFQADEFEDNYIVAPARSADEYRGDQTRIVDSITKFIDEHYDVIITASASGTLTRLIRSLQSAGVREIHALRSQLTDGFIDDQARLVVLTERDLTGRAHGAQRLKTPKRRRQSIDLMELKPGDFVVHEQHGIGRFVGMQQRAIKAGDARGLREYLVIEYAASKRGAAADKLFVPVDQLDLVSKYIGAEVPKLNKLGGSDWAATKARARSHVQQIAEDLVKLYSARQQSRGFAFSPDTPWQRELEDAFAYQETVDQLTTIDEVKADMEKPIPMDRLICGDVGFGKTEIALRAAFKAVQDSKQVVVLVPTTLLVQQHFETFSERFSGFPVRIAPMSRFQSPQELEHTVEGLADGSVDVVIGTHKLLNPKIVFKDLGLVIIDEEQRFGVEHKETLKALRTNVDVLSLSATPIPRTLEMAVTGIREMSTLATPPEDRLPVLTYVGAYEDSQVVACINRELLRGGQVFYVHNRVQDISAIAEHLHTLVPQARIGLAHGKMGEKQLDAVIRDFWHRDIDVLVCTTIIETGLDIANANTLIVDRADRFGLSQLHQLRGRVGRGHERAYAYFFYDPAKPMTQQAHDRLATIAQHTALGSGFDVAMKDLELRGTGNLLGDAQSGHIEGVGFDLYVRMVSQAVEAYKDPERVEKVSVSIDLPIEASIPADYINADKLRLEIYRKLAAAQDEHDLMQIHDELVDRYGVPPRSLDVLFAVTSMRFSAMLLGITQISSQSNIVRIVGMDVSESLLMRLQRIYKGTQYRPLTHTLFIPSPFTGKLGSSALSQDEILEWVRQLLADLAWRRQ